MFEDGKYLRTSYTGEPFQKVVDAGATLQIFKERLNRYARAFEDPGPAYFRGGALDGRTLAPIDHEKSVPVAG